MAQPLTTSRAHCQHSTSPNDGVTECNSSREPEPHRNTASQSGALGQNTDSLAEKRNMLTLGAPPSAWEFCTGFLYRVEREGERQPKSQP